ncbi:MAG: TetR/AcrR family transcriptional regulator [Thermodesulfobacteriota bacterium]
MASRTAQPQGRAARRSAAAAASPRAAAREAREHVYREHILAAGEKVFAQQDFDAAKVQDISRLAGLSMGSIYALFPSKDHIYASIIEKRGNELLALVQKIAAEQREPVDALEALASAYIEYFYAHPDFLRMNLRTGAAWALRMTYPGTRTALADAIHALQSEIFARGVAAGAFIDEDPAYLGVLFSGIDQIHLAHWVANGMKDGRDELRDRLLRVVRKTFLR